MITVLDVPKLFSGVDKALHTFLLFLILCKSLVTCCRPGEYEINGICCPMCPAGNVVRDHCTATTSSTLCIPCVVGTYMDNPNGLTKCMRCSECDIGAGLVMKYKCTFLSNTVCECAPGYFCEDSCDICMPHEKCKPGQFIKVPGTQTRNTECEACPPGHFSNESMAEACTPWKKCSYISKHGTSTSDSECGRHRLFLLAPVAAIVIAIVFGILHKARTERQPVQERGTEAENTEA